MSTRLKVRKIDFRFEDDIEYQWNPHNPACGNFLNLMSFIAPAFERYFIKAMRQAMPLVTDPAIAEDAELFCLQEGQHSRNHMAHIRLLDGKYPGLSGVAAEVMASYEGLLRDKPLKFHLAYMAALELLFTPAAQYLVENVDTLFGKSDPRIASFMLWHVIEEFEHRHSAIDIYNHVYGDYVYRLKVTLAMARHLQEVGEVVKEGLDRHVPLEHNPGGHDAVGGIFDGTTGKARFAWGLFHTLLPGHSEDNVHVPGWVQDWYRAEEAGEDMTLYYPPCSQQFSALS